MPRRANHEGTIRQRADGRWEASVSFDGHRYYRSGKSRSEAARALNELRREHATGELVRPSRLTVADFLAQWLEANQGTWRPSTQAGYEGIVRNYLVPELGRKRLQSLTPADVARAYARLREHKVGKRTLAIIHARLHRALRQAVLWGFLRRNPADAVEPPRSTYRRPQLWTPAEAARFAQSLPTARWDGPLFALLLGGGLRLGEALALRWDEVGDSVARVSRTRTHLRGEWLEGEPKTAAGARSVALPDFTVRVLQAWRRVQAGQRLQAGPSWSGESRIVTTVSGRSPTRWQVENQLRRRAKGLGLTRLRPHDLRHLSASLALSQGIPLPDVSRRLGHANVAVTASVYAHAVRADDAHVAGALERLVSGAAE